MIPSNVIDKGRPRGRPFACPNSEVLAVTVVHCYRPCYYNRNTDDRCELKHVYLLESGCCSGFRCRPLPEPVPTFNRLDTHQERWQGKRGKVWK